MSPARSTPSVRQLLVPLILLGLALTGLTLFTGWWQMNRQLDGQLTERARTVARALRFAAETTDSRESMIRLTRTLVAGGDIELVCISGGQPRRIMITSQPELQGAPVARLAEGGFDALACAVLAGESRAEYLAHDRTRSRFVYACRLEAAVAPSHPLAAGAVVIELLTADLQKRITHFTLWTMAGVLLLGAAGTAGFAWLLQVRVLRPLTASLTREREAGRLKVNFLGMISHEFRNTLGLVLSSTQILARYRDRLAEEDRARHLAKIEASCRRLSGVVEDTLFYSRSESGRLERNLASLDLPAFCLAEAHAAEPAPVADRTPRIQFITEPNAPVEATTDESLLRHVVANLLANALKYSPATAPVRLTLSPAGLGQFSITVEDRGIGIPPDERARLGEPFWRGRNVGAVPGTGLGLVVVHRCLDLLGGRLQIASPAQGGARFVVTLALFPTDPCKPS
ncbi:MAG: HAMP domain-containing histidine kinase [Opitutaceae bacterium]|nr:HAMP domain-containing histidine kinase [Opitutaceae bacterium]